MEELSSIFEFLRKVFIVTGIIGALEVLVCLIIFVIICIGAVIDDQPDYQQHKNTTYAKEAKGDRNANFSRDKTHATKR